MRLKKAVDNGAVDNGSEDRLVHCLKPNQPCAAGLDQLKALHKVTLEEKRNPFVGLIGQEECDDPHITDEDDEIIDIL